MQPAASSALPAIGLFIACMLCWATMGIGIQLLAPTMHSTQIVLLRNIMSLGLILGWSMYIAKGKPSFKTTRLRSHFWRATFGISSMQLWFYSQTVMSLNLATALSFVTPIFAAILAISFLGEKAGLRRWGAILVGFAGIMVILRPDIGGVHPLAWVVLVASFLMAISGTLVKALSRTESPETIVFYMAAFMTLWSLPPGIAYWKPVELEEWGLVLWVAVCSTIAHVMMARAFKMTDMVVLLPFEFTRLIFAAILSFIFFGDTLDGYTIAGALIIVASSVYIAHREALHHKKSKLRVME